MDRKEFKLLEFVDNSDEPDGDREFDNEESEDDNDVWAMQLFANLLAFCNLYEHMGARFYSLSWAVNNSRDVDYWPGLGPTLTAPVSRRTVLVRRPAPRHVTHLPTIRRFVSNPLIIPDENPFSGGLM